MLKSSPFSFSFLTEILSSPSVKPWASRLHPSAVLAVVKGALNDVSQEAFSAASELRRPDLAELIDKIVGRLSTLGADAEPLVVDARGRVFADDFERLAPEAIAEASWALSEPRTEFSERKEAARKKETLARLCQTTGAEGAAIFSNLATARIAVLETLGTGAELVVARRDLYERDNGERLETALDFFPIVRREIGACNAVDLADYAAVCNAKTALVWTTRGRWTTGGRRVDVAELTKLRAAEKLNFAILGEFEFAPILDLSEFFDAALPTIGERLKNGYDLALCDGAQLIGGPSCGLVFGSRARIDAILKTRTAAATKLGRVETTALAKTIELSCERDAALAAIPALRILSTSLANLENRAKRLAALLETAPCVASVRTTPGRSALCANATFGSSPTCLVEVRPMGRAPAELALLLEASSPRLLTRWTRDALTLDLKTVAPEYDLVVAEIFEKIAPAGERASDERRE
ncbi:MAG: hypothetical protein IJO46_11835 [Thermoguttaceae bacterium]|nr:hypothetical protein [Thermoguttaceae bacterium]